MRLKTVIVELRAAEGGSDAKDLVLVQAKIYSKYAERRGLTLDVLREQPGYLSFKLTGPDQVINRFSEMEQGGMRHQRIPPTEKRGRVHTSTVTSAVLPIPSESELLIDERDLEWATCRGSGAGGQHRNVTDSAVQLTHKPTKLMVRCESERSQHQNKATALSILRAKLQEAATHAATQDRNNTRKAQLGTGQRGDKTRTYRHQDDVVTDHTTGKRAQFSRVVRGFLEDLW